MSADSANDEHASTQSASAVSDSDLESVEKMRLMDRPLETVERLLQIFAAYPDHPDAIALREDVEYVARAWGISLLV